MSHPSINITLWEDDRKRRGKLYVALFLNQGIPRGLYATVSHKVWVMFRDQLLGGYDLVDISGSARRGKTSVELHPAGTDTGL